MIDSPIALILLGMSAVSAVASYTVARRRGRSQSTNPTTLANLSDAELRAALTAHQESEEHKTRRRVTLLIVEEIQRRQIRRER